MNRRVSLKKNGNELEKRVDFLHDSATALLNEVKSLTPLKRVELDSVVSLGEEVKKFEIYLIERALEKTKGCQTRAADLLKLKHTTLNAKIKRYGISCSKNGSDEKD